VLLIDLVARAAPRQATHSSRITCSASSIRAQCRPCGHAGGQRRGRGGERDSSADDHGWDAPTDYPRHDEAEDQGLWLHPDDVVTLRRTQVSLNAS